MSRPGVDPVLAAVVQAAVGGTGAAEGLLLELDGRVLRVLATAGSVPGDLLGEPVSAGEGVAGYVVASGQPLLLSADSADPRLGEGTASLLGHNPRTVLCVPCRAGDHVIGALELIDAPTFGVAEQQTAQLLAQVAGAALADPAREGRPDVADPAELAGELRRLATADPARYAMVAAIVEALVSTA